MPDYAFATFLVSGALACIAILVLIASHTRLDARLRKLRAECPRVLPGVQRSVGSTPLAGPGTVATDSRSGDDAWSSASASGADALYEWTTIGSRVSAYADDGLINPATRLPMMGGVDIAGNVYGFDESWSGFDAGSIFDVASPFETFSAFDSAGFTGCIGSTIATASSFD